MSGTSFMSNLEHEINKQNNSAYTENGAKMYKTTGKALLDLNFSVSDMRSKSEDEIIKKFEAAMKEDPDMALKWLFFARDVREGLGERRLFRVIIKWLANEYPINVGHLPVYFSEYGRWDDLFALFDTHLEATAIGVIVRQLEEDIKDMESLKPVSLLAKWLPSITATSYESRERAAKIAKRMGFKDKTYRKTIGRLRGYLDVVEKKMTDQKWSDINYESVPSRANLIYADAFLRHDKERRTEYLNDVAAGNAKINSSDVYPHEIIHKIRELDYENIAVLDAMWNNLPNLVDPNSKTIVVADGSASMKNRCYPKSDVTCMDVSYAMAIYFAEKLGGEFHNKYISFSAHPVLVDLNGCNSIEDKIRVCRGYCKAENTNIEAVLYTILRVACESGMSQEDMPANILIISDMEFDRCIEADHIFPGYLNENLFENISRVYADHGYKLPRMCFWNVKGKSGAIPMFENDLGVSLISGFSVNNAKLVMSTKLDPYECLVEQLKSDRYSPISFAVMSDD